MEWKTFEPDSQIEDYLVGIGDDKTQVDAPLVRSYEPMHGKEFFHLYHSGLSSGSLFYIFLKAVNKAGLSSVVVFGPVMIDETPPKLTEKLSPRIKGNTVLVTWTNSSIKDPEETGSQFTVFYRIGKNLAYKTGVIRAYCCRKNRLKYTLIHIFNHHLYSL